MHPVTCPPRHPLVLQRSPPQRSKPVSNETELQILVASLEVSLYGFHSMQRRHNKIPVDFDHNNVPLDLDHSNVTLDLDHNNNMTLSVTLRP